MATATADRMAREYTLGGTFGDFHNKKFLLWKSPKVLRRESFSPGWKGEMTMAWIKVRDPKTGQLLFRWDPETDRVETGERGHFCVVDLEKLRRKMKRKETLDKPE